MIDMAKWGGLYQAEMDRLGELLGISVETIESELLGEIIDIQLGDCTADESAELVSQRLDPYFVAMKQQRGRDHVNQMIEEIPDIVRRLTVLFAMLQSAHKIKPSQFDATLAWHAESEMVRPEAVPAHVTIH
ncbi:MAG TPA: hypothetical protein VEH84_12305 [Alphaproteobacteria bacterium]|nr:hypothetical protein [Alphaproteobacteria bacterium]